MLREFAEEEVRPLAKTIDREHRVPHETLKKGRGIGLLGVPFPIENTAAWARARPATAS